SFTPSSFFGARGALGSSFSSSFFFDGRAAFSGGAGAGGPSFSGVGVSSGIRLPERGVLQTLSAIQELRSRGRRRPPGTTRHSTARRGAVRRLRDRSQSR